MKKILFFIIVTISLISCGKDSEMKSDVKKLVELKCKMKQQFDKIVDINNKVQNITQTDLTDVNSLQKSSDEQMKYVNQLGEIKKVEDSLGVEFNKLSKEIEEKYKSDLDKEKLKKELSLQLSTSGCE